MYFLQNFLKILDAKMETPGMYGWWHLLALVLTALFTVFLCRRSKHFSPDRIRSTVFAITLVVWILEIYKQINFSFSYTEGISFDYQWYAFPFQFCSTPMYAGLLASLTKKGWLHKAACSYLVTYSVFAGICVMLYPATVFIDTIGINIQTMICHGTMISVGIFLLYSGYIKAEHKTILRAIPFFIGCVLLATLMNEIAHQTGLLESETFNMFFISPYCEPSLPVYSLVQGILPFPFCLLVYVVGFTLAAYLILLAAIGIRSSRHNAHETANCIPQANI